MTKMYFQNLKSKFFGNFSGQKIENLKFSFFKLTFRRKNFDFFCSRKIFFGSNISGIIIKKAPVYKKAPLICPRFLMRSFKNTVFGKVYKKAPLICPRFLIRGGFLKNSRPDFPPIFFRIFVDLIDLKRSKTHFRVVTNNVFKGFEKLLKFFRF